MIQRAKEKDSKLFLDILFCKGFATGFCEGERP